MKKDISQKFKTSASNSFSEKPKIDINERFRKADELISKEQISDVGPNANKQLPAPNTITKSQTNSKVEAFVFSENEQQIIDLIMDKFLDKRIIVSKSETVRLAINLLKDIEFDQLVHEYEQLPKLKRGKRAAK